MNVTLAETKFSYPRRRYIRFFARRLIIGILDLLADVQIIGGENLPKEGPLLVVANHFSFLDPVGIIRISPWPIEFIGGAQLPNAPTAVRSIPKLWGYYPVFRGTGSSYALRAAESILQQKGIIGIFPEAGSWADVLRPARPGTAFLASRTGTKILPLGIHGINNVLPIKLKNKPRVELRIGKPFGPFIAKGKGRQRRKQLDEFGDEIMQQIADLLPEEKRGFYSTNPAIREAAKGTEIYPWKDKREGEVKGIVD